MDAAAARSRRRRRLARVGAAAAAGVVVAGSVVGWRVLNANHPRGFVSTAAVTRTQQASIAAYWVHHEFPGTGTSLARVGCPVDVLGATRTGTQVTAYAIVHCWTGDKDCDNSYDGTGGVVATMLGDRVVRARYDDADDYEGGITEAVIYPPTLRKNAENLMTDNGPAGAEKKAIALAGCTSAATT
jgi:hypothetical protein